MQCRGTVKFELGAQALAHPFRRWRTQVELGESRPQVQAGSPDDDRATGFRECRVDLRVR
jgi:hypothetical protein